MESMNDFCVTRGSRDLDEMFAFFAKDANWKYNPEARKLATVCDIILFLVQLAPNGVLPRKKLQLVPHVVVLFFSFAGACSFSTFCM